jgi:hypothetical protein
MLLVRSYRSDSRILSEGMSDRYEFVFELGGFVTDCCRDRDRIFELVELVHVPVFVAFGDTPGREGEGEYDEVESLARLARKEEGTCRSDPVRFSTARDKVSVTTWRNEKGYSHGRSSGTANFACRLF